jgi:hypothetical protein
MTDYQSDEEHEETCKLANAFSRAMDGHTTGVCLEALMRTVILLLSKLPTQHRHEVFNDIRNAVPRMQQDADLLSDDADGARH